MGKGATITTFVISIVSFLFSFIPIINVIFLFGSIGSLIAAIIETVKSKQDKTIPRKLAIASIVISSLAILVFILVWIALGILRAQFSSYAAAQ